MGKDLKGKECGKGLSQRKDGSYSARFTNKRGKRVEKYFPSLPEARNWLADAQYEDRHGAEVAEEPPIMTVDDWFNYWHTNLVGDLAPNTRRNYNERYIRNVQPVIGKMRITNVKPMHCKKILTGMYGTYAGSTIRQTYITMGTMFRAAVNNDIIPKHPMDGVTFTKPVRAVDDIHYLTVDEQKRFLAVAQFSHNANQYALILETGLRTGELIALTWDNIDWKKRTLTVNKTMEYRYSTKSWRAGPPKSKSSYRTIPLTTKAYNILKQLYDTREYRKQSPELNQKLEYMDLRTGTARKFDMRDLVFINYRTGLPIKNSSYDTHIYKLCDAAGIKYFSMHALRHTYATRAIESGMQPKVLQKLLGHSSIQMTMDRYVHVTDDSMEQAVARFEQHNPSAEAGSKPA